MQITIGNNINPVAKPGEVQVQKKQGCPISNFKQVDNNWFRGAQPGAKRRNGYQTIDVNEMRKGFLFLRDQCGVRVILNLRHSGELVLDCPMKIEREVIASLNKEASPDKRLEYIELPLYYPEGLTVGKGKFLLDLFQSLGNKRLFVHCRHGRDRTGNVTGLYQALKHKLPFNKIVDGMVEMGYDPKGGYRAHLANMVWMIKTFPEFREYYQANKHLMAQVKPSPSLW